MEKHLFLRPLHSSFHLAESPKCRTRWHGTGAFLFLPKVFRYVFISPLYLPLKSNSPTNHPLLIDTCLAKRSSSALSEASAVAKGTWPDFQKAAFSSSSLGVAIISFNKAMGSGIAPRATNMAKATGSGRPIASYSSWAIGKVERSCRNKKIYINFPTPNLHGT